MKEPSVGQCREAEGGSGSIVPDIASELDDLREQLDRVSDIAESLADEPRVPQSRPAYLPQQERDRWQPVIERLASDEQPVTFVVGAGASIESGLPPWTVLVRRLVEDVAPRLPARERRAWVEAIEAEGIIPAAAIARVLARDGRKFQGSLWKRLYGEKGPGQYRPGALAEQIAYFKHIAPERTRIVTTNYDDLLEQALRTRGLTVEARADADPEPAGVACVYHIHGRLNAGAKDREVVLSEEDYVAFQTGGRDRWQDDLMRDLLGSTLCVFVGLSFTDPNIIRWVYAHAQGSHLAVFTRQGAPRLAPRLRGELERATKRRWEAASVQVVFADFYGELAQLIHEAALRRIGRRETFHARAAKRRRRGSNLVVPDGPRRFPRQQQRVAEALREMLNGVRETALAAKADLSGEDLGLALWGVDHERAELSLWASVDRLYTAAKWLVPVPLDYASQWVAVEAVTQCKPVERDPRVYASRWRYIRGIPLIWREADGQGRVPVGALSLTSMTPHATSALGGLPEPDKREIDRGLHEVAVLLFS